MVRVRDQDLNGRRAFGHALASAVIDATGR